MVATSWEPRQARRSTNAAERARQGRGFAPSATPALPSDAHARGRLTFGRADGMHRLSAEQGWAGQGDG